MTDLFAEDVALDGGIATPKITDKSYQWWSECRHGGCLIGPSQLSQYFPPLSEDPLSSWHAENLRRYITRLTETNDKASLNLLLDFVLTRILGFTGEYWSAGNDVDHTLSVRAITGEAIKPRRVWTEPNGGVLPVFIPPEAATGIKHKTPALGLGRGRRSVARVIEWLRATNNKIALLTNGYQWRLIHAGPDFDAWTEWDIDAWFSEGQPGPQVDALRLLLNPKTLSAPAASQSSPLVSAILDTRKGQAELSSELGERVRQAVELLLRESRKVIDDARANDNVTNRDIYVAATRIIMRLVIVRFAESRFLLPVDKFPVYENSYSLDQLIKILDRDGGGKPLERLRDRHGAWPRLLALFRLLYHGSEHELLTITRYGGGLFQPGDKSSSDPIIRALAALENPQNEVSDGIVATILELLTKAPVKVRQGRSATKIMSAVDFSQLDTEYIGILYEGLLDYELRRTEDATPIIFLAVGNQPALPLTRLEEMDDKAVADLVKKLGKVEKPKSGDEDASSADEDEDEEDSADNADDNEDNDAVDTEVENDQSDGDSLSSSTFDDSDEVQIWRNRAHDWARRAVEVGKIVKKPKGKQTAEKQRDYESAIDKAARGLIARLLVPGEYYLVRFGGTRKGSGTFYTKPQLARPTVRRTLAPLCSEIADGGIPIPRTPAEILDLKVCDPAVGSGSFIIGSLRYLGNALYNSLFHHDWLTEDEAGRITWGSAKEKVPQWFAEALNDVPGINEPATPHDDKTQSPEDKIRARLKRIIVERCLYGVDLDPLAIDLARLALWVETMDYNLPFSFLDHKIKCGNALVGCWFDRFQDYPTMAWEREGGDKTHSTGVHFPKGIWSQAIKKKKAEVKSQIKDLARHMASGIDDVFGLGTHAEERFREALGCIQDMHRAGMKDQDRQIDNYQRYQVAIADLRRAFDTWCALWFWPADKLDIAPMPLDFGKKLSDDDPTLEEARRLAAEQRFFHWELEFPDVFNAQSHGFSAIVGNPPWEIQKPNSKEWFSNIDPLYRTYGKQEALATQKAMFDSEDETERDWLLYNAHLKGLGNWCKNAGEPFDKKQSLRGGVTYADPKHPFRHQGSADVNTYKLFLELGHALLSTNNHKYTADGGMGILPMNQQTQADTQVAQRSVSTNQSTIHGQDGHATPRQTNNKSSTAESGTGILPVNHGLERHATLNGHATHSNTPSGRLGLIVPSGIYTDRGSTELRSLFLNQCRWQWLFGFENREKIFDIDSRFKFCPIIIEKGGKTESFKAAFMIRDLVAWEDAEQHVLDYPADRVQQFSPKSLAILEIRSEQDLAILEKMYSNGVLLGDDGPDGWGIKYACEFHMTNDSKLFPPRPKWEEKGYVPDEYGHWLKGNWRPVIDGAGLPEEEKIVHDRSRDLVIKLDEIEDVALPLYEGRMIGQFDFSQKGWVSGKGRSAVWRDIDFPEKVIEPQYLMGLSTLAQKYPDLAPYKVAMMDVTSSTNTRTMIASALSQFPCGHKVPTLTPASNDILHVLAAETLFDSYVYDYQLRTRFGATSLIWSVLEDTTVDPLLFKYQALIAGVSASLSFASATFSPAWVSLADRSVVNLAHNWYRSWAVTKAERLRCRVIADAFIAHVYRLDILQLNRILLDCGHPAAVVGNKAFARNLDPKGFWRIDKNLDPELRHTVLAQVAFADLQSLIGTHGEEAGLRRFIGTGPDDGWMLPETLRLADYNLGHDDRAKYPQPVASRLGPRFYDWQLSQTPEESWAECRMHAEKIRRIRAVGVSSATAAASGQAKATTVKHSDPPGDLFSTEEIE